MTRPAGHPASFTTSCAIVSPAAVLRHPRTTVAPRLASATAVALPSPEPGAYTRSLLSSTSALFMGQGVRVGVV